LVLCSIGKKKEDLSQKKTAKEAVVKRADAPVARDPREDEVDLVELSAPPTIDEAVGHWVLRQGTDKEGYVDAINTNTGAMTVLFEKSQSDVLQEESVPYREKGLLWFKESHATTAAPNTDISIPQPAPTKCTFVPSSQPAFTEAVGHFVRIEDDAAVVVDVVKNTHMLKIRFVDNIVNGEILYEDDDIDEIPYRTKGLQWLAPEV
jgi:hypothetical protein